MEVQTRRTFMNISQPPSVCHVERWLVKVCNFFCSYTRHLPWSSGLCDTCSVSGEETMANLRSRIRRREERLVNAHLVCASCTSSAPADAIHCISLDCPWFYSRRKAEAETGIIPALEELVEELEERHDQEVEPQQQRIEIHSDSSRYHSPTASDIYEETM